MLGLLWVLVIHRGWAWFVSSVLKEETKEIRFRDLFLSFSPLSFLSYFLIRV